MLLITDLNAIPSIAQPCGLTIGSFDGVHLGHQALLRHLKSKLSSNGILAVFTFSNHPSQLFNPENPTPLINSPLQKVKLLEKYGAHFIFLIPFTAEFAQTPFQTFLQKLKQQLSFSHLVLGSGAALGKNKEGDEAHVRHLGEQLAYTVDYLPKVLEKAIPISSGRIRTLISQGLLHEVQSCLGRPYSLVGRLNQEQVLTLPGLCLPPERVYPVHIKTSSSTHLGMAYISPAKQILRIDLLEAAISLKEQDVEVIF
jgi:riboflavin kinase/FMN adenylyltransferase